MGHVGEGEYGSHTSQIRATTKKERMWVADGPDSLKGKWGNTLNSL